MSFWAPGQIQVELTSIWPSPLQEQTLLTSIWPSGHLQTPLTSSWPTKQPKYWKSHEVGTKCYEYTKRSNAPFQFKSGDLNLFFPIINTFMVSECLQLNIHSWKILFGSQIWGWGQHIGIWVHHSLCQARKNQLLPSPWGFQSWGLGRPAPWDLNVS